MRLRGVTIASIASLAVVTVIIAAIEGRLAVPDASAVYLLAVVGIAVAFGTRPAVLTAIGAFLLYDFLFIEPRFTLTVADACEWLNLLLLLAIEAIVGRLPSRDRGRRATVRIPVGQPAPAARRTGPGETRVLAAAADQLGGSLERDRLRRDAFSAELSRRSEALKSALLDSVSRDLRTPLASIRPPPGRSMDPAIDWPPAQRREIAASVDREAEWLNRLVTNLLDMSRVEAGELRPNLVALDAEDAVEQAVDRGSGPDRARPLLH